MADLDRLLILTVRNPRLVYDEANDQFVDGPIVINEIIWTRAADQGSGTDVTSIGALITRRYRNFLLRWRADLAALEPAQVVLTDDMNLVWTVENIAEAGPERRAFLELACSVTTGFVEQGG